MTLNNTKQKIDNTIVIKDHTTKNLDGEEMRGMMRMFTHLYINSDKTHIPLISVEYNCYK